MVREHDWDTSREKTKVSKGKQQALPAKTVMTQMMQKKRTSVYHCKSPPGLKIRRSRL